jgi:TRAP-type C4-dicarboxylate transport system permease small subunit
MSAGGMLVRVDRVVAAALKGISVACLAALFGTVAFVVVTRVFGLRSAGWTDELIELLFAWLLFP